MFSPSSHCTRLLSRRTLMPPILRGQPCNIRRSNHRISSNRAIFTGPGFGWTGLSRGGWWRSSSSSSSSSSWGGNAARAAALWFVAVTAVVVGHAWQPSLESSSSSSSWTVGGRGTLRLLQRRLRQSPFVMEAGGAPVTGTVGTSRRSTVHCEGLRAAPHDDDNDQNDASAVVVVRASSRPAEEIYGGPEHCEERTPPLPRSHPEGHHIIFSGMIPHGMVQDYRVFRRRRPRVAGSTGTNPNVPTTAGSASSSSSDDDEPVVVASVRLGAHTCGHEGYVHGGLLALLVDDTLGFAYEALPTNPPKLAMTANLNVNFRAPLPSSAAGPEILILVRLRQRERRKLGWDIRVMSPDREILYCEATSLFVIPKAYYTE